MSTNLVKKSTLSNPKDSATTTYFGRESLPLFLTEERFNELEVELQDFIVNSTRMQYFLQSKIDIENSENLLSNAKKQFGLMFKILRYIEDYTDRQKDLSPLLHASEMGELNIDIILQMKESYSDSYMKLRIPNWRKK